MTREPLLTKHGVAERLYHTLHWFAYHRAKLEAAGFPPPVPACGERWDPQAIDNWIARQRGETVETTIDPHIQAAEQARISAGFAARAREVAAGIGRPVATKRDAH